MSAEKRLLPINPDARQSGRAMCAYFEEQWRPEDMDEIQAHGFDAVVLCVKEQHLDDMQRANVETAQHAQAIGLDVWADPWAFAGIMGGDIASEFELRGEASRMDNPRFTRLFREAIDYARSLGASTMFWDELNFSKRPDHVSVENEVMDLMKYVTDCTRTTGKKELKNAVCLTSTEPHMTELAAIAGLQNVDYVGTDPYYFPNYPGTSGTGNDHPTTYVGKWAARVAAIAQDSNTTPFTFAQGFALGEDSSARHWSEVPLMQAQAAVDARVKAVGFWGFRACQGTPNIDGKNNWLLPGNPDVVWNNTRYIRDIVDERRRYDLSTVPGALVQPDKDASL